MAITVQCESCGARLKAPDHLAGMQARCRCGSVIAVPIAATRASADRGAAPGPRAAQAAPQVEASALAGAPCPTCGGALPAGSVLCIICGFDLRTGKFLAPNVERDATANPGAARASRARPTAAAAGPPSRASAAASAGLAALIRLVTIAVVVGVVGGGAWWVYSVVKFDPVADAKARIARVGNGLTLEEVVGILGKPQEVYTFVDPFAAGAQGPLGGMAKIGYGEDFLKLHGRAKLKRGFFFVYRFAMAAIYHVHFSPDGHVETVMEAPNLFR